MSCESLVRREAERRGWRVERREREIGAVRVPCFTAPRIAGHCEIWVGIEPDSDKLHVSHDWQQNAPHVANIRGLSGGLYDRSGAKLAKGVIGSTPSSCTLSIKLKERDYEDAWEALNTYVKVVYSMFLGQRGQGGEPNARPFKFDVLGDQVREAVEWRDLIASEHVAVVGLGGVGAWIADFVAKSDAREVHGWDHDCIEPKNILRMPGAPHPREWIGKPKAEWFQDTYCRIHEGVHGHEVRVQVDNVQDVFQGTTFAFVAVDCDQDRMMVCDSLASAEIPFVVAGLSLVRRDKRVKVAMRVVTAHPGLSSWRQAIPQVGQSGQDDYGSLDMPDVYSMAAGWAVQSWRKMRGQVWQDKIEECLVYRADDQTLIAREA